MDTVYRIRNWDKHFENNRTRELKTMSWVPIPNNHDSDGYVTLVDHEHGSAHFAVWIVLVQIASKCDPRGILVRSSRHPHTDVSLSRISRLPKGLVTTAMQRLVKIGWLEAVSVGDAAGGMSPQDGARLPHRPALGLKLPKKRPKNDPLITAIDRPSCKGRAMPISVDDATGRVTSHLGAGKPQAPALNERRKERKKTTDRSRRRQSDISLEEKSEEKSQLAQTLKTFGVRNKRALESLALTPGLTVERINQLHAKALEKAQLVSLPASGLLVTMIRDRDWENIRYDTPKAAVTAWGLREWKTVNGLECSGKRVTCNASGIYVDGALVVSTEDLAKANFS